MSETLVAAQLSSLLSTSRTIHVAIQTARRNAPLATLVRDAVIPFEHATIASLSHLEDIGDVLIRVIHGGLTLELLSLSFDIPAIRFAFPAAILPKPAVFAWNKELHIIAVTKLGSLFRLVIPWERYGQRWQEPSGTHWCREYLIKNFVDDPERMLMAQVQDIQAVGISTPAGGLLRLQLNVMGNESHADQWSETVFESSSFLRGLTSFLPAMSSDTKSRAQIVAMASHPPPTDICSFLTLSRDRTIRLWMPQQGCVYSRTLPSNTSTNSNGSPTPDGRSVSPFKGQGQTLLEGIPQKLLGVFPSLSLEESPRVVAFTPTPSSAASGGFFCIYRLNDSSLELDPDLPVEGLSASARTARCHMQDFVIVGHYLWVLWDEQGQSRIEKCQISGFEDENNSLEWVNITYPYEPELTPAYLDELLLSPGSMTATFFEAIIRPGVFSPLTLRTALEHYVESHLALPGSHPPQLTTTYATLGESIAAIVGCTVDLRKDPLSGAQLYGNYWSALKRDWEGFVARCREIERSARWPLALGNSGQNGDLVIIERERLAIPVNEDAPLAFHRFLLETSEMDPEYPLLQICWQLRSNLPQKTLQDLETSVVDTLHQEIAFSLADIVRDRVKRLGMRDMIPEDVDVWASETLKDIEDLAQSIHKMAAIVDDCPKGVKMEEQEVEIQLQRVLSQSAQGTSEANQSEAVTAWRRALAANYIAHSVEARYNISLSQIVMVFFLADQLDQWSPSTLAEIFAQFRSVAMLRHLVRQPAGDLSGSHTASLESADEVVLRMRNMQMSGGSNRNAPTYSLVHRLLSQSYEPCPLPMASYRFLNDTGLFESNSPVDATDLEVLFCDRLRLSGYLEVAREMLAWLPRTPGVMYVLGRLWLDMGRGDDATSVMQSLAASFGPDAALLEEDKQALQAVLPGRELFDSVFSFYVHVAGLFKASSMTAQEVQFARLALSVAEPGLDTLILWREVIAGSIELARYDDAYMALVAAPYENLRKECVPPLVFRMCEENTVGRLMSFNFGGFVHEVESALSFKARNADPRAVPSYPNILYTWHMARGDYRSAALTMYQRSRKLNSLIGDPSTFVATAELQLESLMVAMNALSLLDRKNAWLVVQTTSANGAEMRKRRKLSKYIPEEQYTPGSRDAEIVELADIQYEFTLLTTRLDLLRSEPSLLPAGEFLLPPDAIILHLAQAGRIDLALSTARSLNLDMTDIFVQLTRRCLRLSHRPDLLPEEAETDWLMTDNATSWTGTPAQRGWQYLQTSLARLDGPSTDFTYTKATLEVVLEQSKIHAPQWLVEVLERQHPEFIIRTYLRYSMVSEAIQTTLSMLRVSADTLDRQPAASSSAATWLPYTLIDQVLSAAEPPSAGDALRAAIQTRIKQMDKRSAQVLVH